MCNDTVASQGLCSLFCGFLYDDGYTQGSEEGYSKGFDAGLLKGSHDGFAKGFEDGHKAGYSKGFDAGFLKGSDDGLAKGFEAGYKSGHDKGYYKGLYDADYPISYLINNQVLVIENVLFCLLIIYFWWNMRHKRKGYETL
ncbi:hypothetical protein MVEG_00040 [Podila verticillata NRRL 6337]|nr:MAG: hypothetical protein BYD32DRAFT_403338 [Podila humilis]KFH72814.1 hypothetical protein MVEG_00040 [Podila verticillata NRRL 6337]